MTDKYKDAQNIKETINGLTAEEQEACLFFMTLGLRNYATIITKAFSLDESLKIMDDGLLKIVNTFCYSFHEKEINRVKDLLKELEKQVPKMKKK